MTVTVGRLAAAWRYPVSSAAGERLAALDAVEDGIAGDRRFAIVDGLTGQTAVPERERRWHPVPFLRAALDERGMPAVWLPGDEAPQDAAGLARHFGFAVRIAPYGPAPGARLRYRHSHAHLLTTASMSALSAELPGSAIDPARFRPNLVVETAPGMTGMVEQDWIGREVRIGTARLAINKPCGRCSFTSLPQDDLPLDREVLRALIRRHARQFGVLCHVIEPGRMAEGDAVILQ